ncbi:signal recognition particle protein [Aeromicrobium fastidiosum]|uniref:Signal recognition particle protein n=1 Tax=Aeromicrobium fastidiosum TaxID=52699 RepID=A0A641AL55_9ACTN|nr:signal recognition particle protein [Aeromicrobium fastidiosum]KAA1376571.1 signal recognition particle protein [Aeromicrobium fastidiosum]MBP2391504.1 signal recognition particle subunit SRP54 [Aeromicrobium fastidiosum]
MFDTLQDRLQSAFKNLRGKGRLSEADIDAVAREIRVALLDADVAVSVVREFIARVKERALGAEVSQSLNPAQQVIKIVNDELIEILGGETRRIRYAKTGPTVIMLAGLQGAGKTTLAGKLGLWLKEQGKSPMLVAADLQRPNAVTQLQVVGEQAGVKVFAPEPGNGVGDPVAVARAGLAEAQRTLHDVVVVDTAGRLGIDAELMQQAADIRAAVDPDEVLFVIDAMIGQDAVVTAEAFLEGVDFTGVVLTKLDGDARGGAALSVRSITGRPIMFASTGEKLTDFDAFHPDRMAGRILDMGDMLTLIEQAEKAFDSEQAAKDAEKLMGGSFTLDDFLKQMEAISKMGSMTKIMGLIPGMGQYKEQIENFDDREVDKIKAIILSMTPAERDNPKIIDGSRRARISKGSGTQVKDVNGLVDRFFEARKMMQQMAKGGGMPGMPGLPGVGKRAGAKQKPQQKKKGKRVSGNPAKRAAAASGAPAKNEGANAFGFPAQGDQPFELPKELKDLM